MNNLPGKKYSVLYVDPPWSYNDKANAGERGANHKYNTMSIADMKELPVADLAADNAVMFMWATFPILPECLELLKAWGFEYKTVAFTWVKRNKNENSFFWGMGNWTRANAEIVLLGVKGKPKRKSAKVHQIVYSPLQQHSRKPDVVRTRIERLMGRSDHSFIELFARRLHDGWDAWGNEVYDEKATHHAKEKQEKEPKKVEVRAGFSSDQEQQVFDYLKSQAAINGDDFYSPTKVGQYFGKSYGRASSWASKYLKRLTAKGYVERNSKGQYRVAVIDG